MAKENQLVIDLGDVSLSEKQLASLQKALHKVVSQKVKKAKPAKKENSNKAATVSSVEAVAGRTASLQVDFFNVDAGLSNLTANFKGVNKTIQQSDTISFDDVKAGDSILISGDSAGSKTVTISGVNAVPMQMSFAEGQFIDGVFLITG